MPEDARDVLVNCRNHGTELSLDQHLDLVQKFLSESEETIIVLDGLDLVDEHVIKALAQIVESAIVHGSKVQILATSRISSVVEGAIQFAPQNLHRKGLEWQNQLRSAIIPRRVVNKDIDVTFESYFINSPMNTIYDFHYVRDIILAPSKGM